MSQVQQSSTHTASSFVLSHHRFLILVLTVCRKEKSSLISNLVVMIMSLIHPTNVFMYFPLVS